MISNDVFTNVFGNVPAGDEDNLVRVAVGAVRAGWAVVVDRPGSKAPMCTLTARQAKAADKLARQAAEAAGDPSYARRRHACGLHHALSDDATARRVVARLVKDNGPVNLGLELGRSRLVVVDVDTADERDSFLTAWGDASDDPPPSPTVLSPGARDKDGQWVHKDGGHYWFTLPDGIELPQGMGVLKGEGGWSVMWRDKQVLVPPSSRPEGTYRLVSAPMPLPGWLRALIVEQASQRLAQRSESVKRALSSDSSIDRWAATAAWGDLLEPDGWTDTGLIDNCGCPVWTAPGGHASPKSATAHDHGCDRYDTIGGHAPLHVWTDNPPEWVADALSAKGTSTITKLTYLAYRFHGGDNKVAVRELGIGADDDDPFFGSSGSTADAPSSPKSSPAADPMDDEEDLSDDDQDPDEDDEEGESDPVQELMDQFLTLEQLEELPDLAPLVPGVLDLDTLNRVTGRSNHGKTFAMIDLAGRVATGTDWNGKPVTRGLVAYVAAEGVQGFRKRARAWESRHGLVMGENMRVLPMPVQTTDVLRWARLVQALKRLDPVLVVFDTQARITVGQEENSAKDMGKVVDQVEKVRQATGACTVLVHHLGHVGEHARGSSTVIGAVSTEIRVSKGEDGRITLSCAKQKDHEEFEDVHGVIESEDSSAVLVYEGDGTNDPFDSPARMPERPLWQRMAEIVGEAAPTLGLTRTDAIGLTRDRYTVPRGRRTALYKAWDKIVDGGWVDEITNMDTGKGTGRFVLAREMDPGLEEEGT